MKSKSFLWAVRTEIAPSTILKRLLPRFGIEVDRDGATESEGSLYDSFDWRVFGRGAKLELSERSLELHAPQLKTLRRTLEGTESVTRAIAPEELPDGPLRDKLVQWVSPRVLLRVAKVRHRTFQITVYDNLQKTIGRGTLTHTTAGTALGQQDRQLTTTVIEVDSLRGYADDLQAAVYALGDDEGAYRVLEAILSTAGRPAGAYSPKLTIRLHDNPTASEAIDRVVRNLTGAMRENMPGIVECIDSEFLHDYRVALRRLRSFVGECKGVIEPTALSHAGDSLRALARPTGHPRDLDVLLLDRLRYHSLVPAEMRPGLEMLFAAVARQREQAYTSLASQIRSGVADALIHDVESALRTVAAGAGQRAIVNLARKRLDKRVSALLRVGEAACEEPERMHDLRIAAKKLRYFLELFRDVIDPRVTCKLLNRVKRMQDHLGVAHDIDVQRQHLRDALRELERIDVQRSHAERVQIAAAVGGVIATLSRGGTPKGIPEIEADLRAIRKTAQSIGVIALESRHEERMEA